MHKSRKLKTSCLGLQLSATVRAVMLLSFLLLYLPSASILTNNNNHIASAIPNVYINNTSASSTANASSVKPVNHPPVANAGSNQVVNENMTVALVGAGIDSDPNDTLRYMWRQIAGPAVNLSNRSSTNPTFIAPIVRSDTELVFSLTVTDDKGDTSSPTPVTITIKGEQYTFVRAWGSEGTENGQFNGPSGIATDSSDNVYVTDSGNDRIQVFAPAK